jgi:asparagine synthase (glutamine-hydrolysing)
MNSHIAADFPAIVEDLDEPFADPSAFPTWYLCRHATQTVKTVLGGDGLDELLGGYKRVWKHLRTTWRRNWSAPWLPLSPGCAPKGWSKWSAEFKMSWLDSYSLRFSGFTPSQRRFLQPDRLHPPPSFWRMQNTSNLSPLASLLETDLENYLPEYILRKSDLCGMAHGLEIRAPFLDHHWIEALNGLDPGERFARPAKSVMQRVCPGLKPLGVFERPKRGFSPPLRSWLEGDLAERFDGLGTRLESATGGQLDATAVDLYSTRFLHAKDSPAEQLLQLLVLDESLRQLRAID